MKLKHDAICSELRSWAAETKQEIVAAEVAHAYFSLGGGELPLTPIDSEHATHNNKQRLFRWVHLSNKPLLSLITALKLI
ncbi:hypothetical protein [Yersinia intermedia]|uniref:hypothetical protein n=1 Tax=Yersinia intermedia TaxID=631 RepID=UPI001643CD52|nr:hypothetical protein [Yersinia intermedia]